MTNAKNKKWICIIVFIAMLFTCFIGIDYGHSAADTTAPVLKDLTIMDADNVDATGSLTAKIDLREEESGVSGIMLHFDKGDGVKRTIYFDPNEDESGSFLFSGIYTIEIPIDNALGEGKYYLIGVEMTDLGDNTAYYGIGDLNRMHIEREITVTKSDADLLPAVVNSFTIRNHDHIDAQGKMIVDIDITAEGSGVNYISLSFSNEDGSLTSAEGDFFDDPLFTGQKTLELKLADNFGNGRYDLLHIQLQKNNGIQTRLAGEELDAIGIQRYVNVYNSTADVVAPKLNSLSFESSEITLPGLIKVNMDMVEEDSGFYTIGIKMCNGDGHTIEVWSNPLEERPIMKTGNWTISLPVNPFIGKGKYDIERITIWDNDMNARGYDCEELQEICPDGSITLNSAFDIAYNGSLGNKNSAIKAIKRMKAGETAVLDCRYKVIAPKEMFEAIAGVDKTLVFENETVQWVFNGLKVEEEKCKDIDLTTGIDVVPGYKFGFPDDEEIVTIQFRDNGELPGEADVRVNDEYIRCQYALKHEKVILSYLEDEDEDFPEIEDEDIDIEEDYAAVLEIDHNSTFALSKTKPRKVKITKAKLGKRQYTYSGSRFKPGVIVKVGKKNALSKGYSVKYNNNKNVGKATAVIKGKGIYKGTIKKSFTINPKGTKIDRIKKKNGRIIIKWRKQSRKMSKSRITGYQLQFAADKKFTKSKKRFTIKGYKKTSKKFAKLGKTRKFVRVRTYKTVKGKRYYSPWSKAKKIKVR